MTRLAMNGVNRPKTQNGAGQRLALIVSKFPCVDETFILREINALAQNGFRFDIYSIKYSNDRVAQPQRRVCGQCARGETSARDLCRSTQLRLVFISLETC